MTGIVMALGGVLALTLADTGKKRLATTHGLLPVVVACLLAGTVLLGGYSYLFSNYPLGWETLWWCLPCSIVLGTVCELLFTRALIGGQVTLVMPLKAVAPLISLPLSFAMTGEIPTALGMMGVAVAIVGTYLLYGAGPDTAVGMWAPFKRLATDRHARNMVLALAGFPLLGNLQKIGAAASSPAQYQAMIMFGQLCVFYCLLKRSSPAPTTPSSPGWLWMGVPFLWTVGLSLTFMACSYTLVTYVVVLGQLQPLFMAPLAYFLFHEKAAFSRIGPMVMTALGACMVALWG